MKEGPRQTANALELMMRDDLRGVSDKDADLSQTPVWQELFGDSGLRTFAVLDGASITGLPEILEASDLAHDCLFVGDARKEMADHAPWVVELSGDHSLTRVLLSDAKPPLGLWEKSGFFVHSREDLDAIVRHLRYFTRVKDENGKWFFFRFWEPDFVPAYLSAMKDEQRVAFFGNGTINAVIATGQTGCVARFDQSFDAGRLSRQIVLSADVMDALSQVAEARFRQTTIMSNVDKHGIDRKKAAQIYQEVFSIPIRTREALEIITDVASSLEEGLSDPRIKTEVSQSIGAPDLVRAKRIQNAVMG